MLCYTYNTCMCTCNVHSFNHFIGQPVGWCIADNEASEVIEIFLGCVKAKSPNTTVKVIMTDDGMYGAYIITITYSDYAIYILTDNTGWSATKAVYGNIKHLLCFWHVDR